MMNNALVKQRKSIGHVDTILQGIHELSEAKVMAGLQGLRHIDFNEEPTPLSPFFDLVTGISPGREDFLTLERMHLLALVIRHMAQGVYQWTQKNNRGVASVTQEALTTSLEKLIKLLEPTKEPCIASITHLHCAKAIASCLAMPASSTSDEWWDRLIFVGELVGDSLQLAASITTSKADSGFKAALSILQRLYKWGASMHEMLKTANEQTLVMQIAAVDAWKEIIMRQADSNVAALEKEPIKKTLESLKQYFEEGILGKESTIQKIKKPFKKAKEAIAYLVQDAPPYRRCLIEVLYTEIAALEENLDNIEALRKIAFHALVDLYVETADESVRCEILEIFGALASRLCAQALLDDKQLDSHIKKVSKVDTIEQAAFRILVAAILPWPEVWRKEYKYEPVALSLTFSKAIELSKKWQIQCTAIEALLRFDNQYKSDKASQDKTPIRTFLDTMGREYHVTALLLNKFRLSEKEIKSLRDFLHHAKGQDKPRELLRKTSSKKLKPQELNIKQWLSEKLKLQDTACDTLLQFLQQDKAQPADQPQQEKYSQEPVRPVLDKLIAQFNLTKAEREVIDEAIFRGQSEHATPKSLLEKVGEALKSFFGQDHYPKIACAFNNLDSIEAMIEAEKQLWVKETAIASQNKQPAVAQK